MGDIPSQTGDCGGRPGPAPHAEEDSLASLAELLCAAALALSHRESRSEIGLGDLQGILPLTPNFAYWRGGSRGGTEGAGKGSCPFSVRPADLRGQRGALMLQLLVSCRKGASEGI